MASSLIEEENKHEIWSTKEGARVKIKIYVCKAASTKNLITDHQTSDLVEEIKQSISRSVRKTMENNANALRTKRSISAPPASFVYFYI